MAHAQAMTLASVNNGTTAAATTVNRTCILTHTCVPDGFGFLVLASVTIMIVLCVVIIWMASPRSFCRCCGQVGRGFQDIWAGSKQLLLDAGMRASDTGTAPEGIETWWTLQPQTTGEIEMVDLQARRAKEDEAQSKLE